MFVVLAGRVDVCRNANKYWLLFGYARRMRCSCQCVQIVDRRAGLSEVEGCAVLCCFVWLGPEVGCLEGQWDGWTDGRMYGRVRIE